MTVGREWKLILLFTHPIIAGSLLQQLFIQSVATLSALGIKVVLGYLGVQFGILGHEAAWVTDPIGWAAAITIVTIGYASGKWKTKAVVSLSSESNEEPVIAASVGDSEV